MNQRVKEKDQRDGADDSKLITRYSEMGKCGSELATDGCEMPERVSETASIRKSLHARGSETAAGGSEIGVGGGEMGGQGVLK